MGDVFRLVYFIETFCQQFSYRTISDNHGQTVVWRARRADLPERTIEEVGRKSFADLVVERDSVLRPAPLSDIIDVLKQRGG